MSSHRSPEGRTERKISELTSTFQTFSYGRKRRVIVEIVKKDNNSNDANIKTDNVCKEFTGTTKAANKKLKNKKQKLTRSKAASSSNKRTNELGRNKNRKRPVKTRTSIVVSGAAYQIGDTERAGSTTYAGPAEPCRPMTPTEPWRINWGSSSEDGFL